MMRRLVQYYGMRILRRRGLWATAAMPVLRAASVVRAAAAMMATAEAAAVTVAMRTVRGA